MGAKTAFFAGENPRDLPVWARLALIEEGIPFGSLFGWGLWGDENTIAVDDRNGRHVLYRKVK